MGTEEKSLMLFDDPKFKPVRVNGGGGDMAQYIREASERLRKQDEGLNVFDDSFLLIGGDNE